MLTNKHLKDFTIRAVDGDIGTVDDLYFDDETWAIRYLTVDTGVEDSPAIDTHKPVSRQHEAAYLGYYGYPYYWGGPCLWGPAFNPAGLPATSASAEAIAEKAGKESADSHMRSTETVSGYHVETADGALGHVDGFVVDDEAWAIRYIGVAMRNWLLGKKVLVSPAWIERVSWADSRIFTGLSREAIKEAPEYIDSRVITREYEQRLYQHYGRPPHWLHGAGQSSSHSLGIV